MKRVYLVAVQLAILFFIGCGLWFKSDDIKPLTWDRWRAPDSKVSVPKPSEHPPPPESNPANATEPSDPVQYDETIAGTGSGIISTGDQTSDHDDHHDGDKPAIGNGDDITPSPTPQDDNDRVIPYITAILDPSSTLFPRLNCSAPNTDRYSYLQAPPDESKLRYFFALDLRQSQAIIPRLLGSIVEAIRFLGPSSCALSIVEGNSEDLTYPILDRLLPELEAMGLAYYLRTSGLDTSVGDRIGKLAELRNLALVPLVPSLDPTSPSLSSTDEEKNPIDGGVGEVKETRSPGNKSKKIIIRRRSSTGILPPASASDTTVIFLNDVAICVNDILELIHQRRFQSADMTCAMDWTYVGDSPTFYDVWVARTMSGNLFFDIPPGGSWDNAWNIFWKDPKNRMDYSSGTPFQVYACWNGAVAFGAGPLLGGEDGKGRGKIEGGFRSSREGECFMGEPTLWCKDMWWEGYGRIAVVPSVNLEYSDEKGEMIKKLKGKTETWTGREMSMSMSEEDKEKNKVGRIEWVDSPPDEVVCMPGLGDQSWRVWNETLVG